MRAGLFRVWVCGAVLGFGAVAVAEPVTRVSDDGEAREPQLDWEEPGFRFALRLGAEQLRGLNAAPGGYGYSFAIEPALRVVPSWSVFVAMHYTLLAGNLLDGQLHGLRFSVTAGPTWHHGGLGVSLGLGLAGDLGTWDPASQGAQSSPATGDCDGTGGLLQLRVGYLIATGPVFSTGPVLQAEVLGLKCGDYTAQQGADPSDLVTVQVAPWWQRTVSLAWAVAWR